jgi:hypothetical protein
MSLDSEWKRLGGMIAGKYYTRDQWRNLPRPPAKPADFGKIHIVIGDTQVKPGVRTDHLSWIGQYIVDHFSKFPAQNVRVIHLGDHWDMPSLSSYDKGKKSMEGRRCAEDIEAGNDGFELLSKPIELVAATWKPDCHILMGNHEDRISRAIENDAQLDGLLSLGSLDTRGWKVHDYLKPVTLEGVTYSHYFYNPSSGKPYGGEIANRLKTIGHSFTMGHQQGIAYAVRAVGNVRHHGLVNGSCLTPDHRVLTADLRYIPLGDVQVGDKLTSFDEETPRDAARRGRAYKTGTVLAVKRSIAKVYAVLLSNGKVFKVTADHRWFTKCPNGKGEIYSWRTTESLRKGTRVVKLLDEWDTLMTYEAGWLAGMYDGEGCYYERETTRGRCGQLTLAQKEGPVLDRIRKSLGDLCSVEGVTDTVAKRDVAHLRVRGGMRYIAKVLGQLRPTRLLPKFKPEHIGQIKNTDTDNPSVVSISPLGEREIVQIDIDEKTMIVDGYAHHNCYLHDERYLGPQVQSYWRGIVVCHQVENGMYDPSFVSLDYLCRRYEGVTLERFLR